MAEFLVPAQSGESEVVEKRSRFLGVVRPIADESEARAILEAVKKKHRDARHNCWCYRLQSGAERYSDDGEPQGTAGVPMLAVLQKSNVTNAVCVVTRYFGGVLLGAGGLVRAYTQAAKEALDAAGVAQICPWTRLFLPCPYPLFEQVKLFAEQCGGQVEDLAYADAVGMTLRFPAGQAEAFTALVRERTAGSLTPERLGEVMAPAPVT